MSGQRLSIGIEGGGAREYLELAAAAEREAVDGIWIGDINRTNDFRGDSFRTMIAAAVAAATRSVRIGCVLTFADAESTLRLAEDVAMIDQGSGGRLELLFATRDAASEAQAARLLSAWRGWATSDGRSLPVTPRPAQPELPRLVAANGFDDETAARLAAGVMARAQELPDVAAPRARLERRVVAFEVGSARALIAGGVIDAVARIRDVADRWETDEVAIWLKATPAHTLADEVVIVSRIIGPGVAGGDAQWEMLAELGARGSGIGSAT